ncbi:MAG: PmoA family protein [Verrucomicrobia bacterium]|nr:PmoA family protein [Verrucomicrobiota bacterium]
MKKSVFRDAAVDGEKGRPDDRPLWTVPRFANAGWLALLLLVPSVLPAADPISVTPETTPYRIERAIDGGGVWSRGAAGQEYIWRHGDQEMFRYQAFPGPLPRADIPEIYRRGGYLTAIQTPSGRLVSGDYPPTHVHHHGIWMAWTKAVFDGREPDFWNMGKGKGRVDCISSGWGLGLYGVTVSGWHRYIDMTRDPETSVLDETWNVTAGVRDWPRRVYIINLESTQTCATNLPLVLPPYHYGGLGVRGHEAWYGETNALFLTSSGETNRIAANETRGKWCWMGGEVDGKVAGMTILCHPANYRFPQPLRVHPKEPYFSYAPQQLGEMTIAPGKPYLSRYRVVVADGRPSVEEANRWYEDYAGAK